MLAKEITRPMLHRRIQKVKGGIRVESGQDAQIAPSMRARPTRTCICSRGRRATLNLLFQLVGGVVCVFLAADSY